MRSDLMWRFESDCKRKSRCGRFTIVKSRSGYYLYLQGQPKAYTRTLREARIAAADVLSGKLRA